MNVSRALLKLVEAAEQRVREVRNNFGAESAVVQRVIPTRVAIGNRNVIIGRKQQRDSCAESIEVCRKDSSVNYVATKNKVRAPHHDWTELTKLESGFTRGNTSDRVVHETDKRVTLYA